MNMPQIGRLRRSRRTMIGGFAGVLVIVVCDLPLIGAPIPADQLTISAVMNPGEVLNGPNSLYNPRRFNGSNFVLQINNTKGIARYPSATNEPASFVSLAAEGEARMWSPMDGGLSTEWVLLAGGADTNFFSRLPYDAEDSSDRLFEEDLGLRPNQFDWVDNDTIVFGTYESGKRGNLYLADVTMDPFSVTLNTTWNSQGFVTTEAGRIRNVRVGDVYDSYAYYAESQVATDARVWALDLTTGVSTQITTIDQVNGSGSWGAWTVKEVDGYLYIHTSDDGIYVYSMTGPTTIGNEAARYEKGDLDAMLEFSGQNWGFDVAEDGRVMLLGYGSTSVAEIRARFRCDLNGDGSADAADAGLMFGNWGQSGVGDCNGDNVIDAADAGILFGEWTGDSAPSPQLVPEPVGAVGIALLWVAAVCRQSIRHA